MKKKTICAAMILTLSCLTAFASGNAAKSGVPTLTWWFYGSSPNNLQEALKVISDYTESKIGVRLDIKVSGWADSQQRMRTIVNSGEYYDLMFIEMTDYNNFVNLGAFADLTDMLKNDAPALNRYIPSLLWDGVKINGKSTPCQLTKIRLKRASMFGTMPM